LHACGQSAPHKLLEASTVTGMTESTDLPEEVTRFIIEHLTSVDQLETLLLLRSQPERYWDAEAVGQALYTQPTAASVRLADLHRQGLLAAETQEARAYRYAPATREIEQTISALAELYPAWRVRIISLIYSKPQDNVRAFADAFRWRQDK
jgi:hypothetical protein